MVRLSDPGDDPGRFGYPIFGFHDASDFAIVTNDFVQSPSEPEKSSIDVLSSRLKNERLVAFDCDEPFLVWEARLALLRRLAEKLNAPGGFELDEGLAAVTRFVTSSWRVQIQPTLSRCTLFTTLGNPHPEAAPSLGDSHSGRSRSPVEQLASSAEVRRREPAARDAAWNGTAPEDGTPDAAIPDHVPNREVKASCLLTALARCFTSGARQAKNS